MYIWMMKNLLIGGIMFIFFISCNTTETKDLIDENIENVDSVHIENDTKFEDVALEKAPNFTLFDSNGVKKSLNDYKGKLIYMDIWATWCGPCRVQIPAMKELEKKYSDKGIVFLSVSVDPEKNKEKWIRMVKDEEMSGEQLYAGVTSSSFGLDYKVKFIPRFIIISPKGDVLMHNAPQPMDFVTRSINPEIEHIFDLYINSNL